MTRLCNLRTTITYNYRCYMLCKFSLRGGGGDLLISASLQVEHLTSNCNLTSQLLRLTKITLQKLHIPHIWPFSPPPPPPSSITLVHKLLLENQISKNQKSWYSDKEILSYATCHKLKNPDSPPLSPEIQQIATDHINGNLNTELNGSLSQSKHI